MKTLLSGARLAALPLALAAASPSFAQSQLQEVVVTATRFPTPITDVTADVTVIDRSTLDRAGQSSLRDILSLQPGVQLSTTGSYRSTTGVFLRGASTSQTLVLVDGIRIGSATSGGAALENIPIERIERIEILRGAASALYGPDAVGGVIQIFTREPVNGFAASANIGFGSDGQQQAGASLRGGNGTIGYSIGLSHEKASGISVITNPLSGSYNPDKDGFTSHSVDARLTAMINNNNSVTLSLLRSQTEFDFDGTPFPNPIGLSRLTSDARAKPQLTNATVKWEAQWTPIWKSTVTLGTSDDESVSNYYRFSDGAFGGTSKFNTDRRQLTWQNDFTFDKDVLSFMLESRSEKVDSSTPYTVTKRNVDSALLSYALNREQWNALAVVREDHNSQFGGFSNWALSGGYRLTGDLRAVASLGTSFQAPSFNQLYFPGFGNPALQPERNRSAELGLRYSQGKMKLGAVVYHNAIDGFIDPGTNVQSSSTVLRGVTLSAESQWGATHYSVSYDYADPRSFSSVAASNNLRLVRVARNVLNARVGQRVGAVDLFGEVKLSSNREDSTITFAPGRDVLGGYAVVNLGGSWNITKDLSLLARLNNVAGKRYSLANGYSMPGRNLFVSLAWAM